MAKVTEDDVKTKKLKNETPVDEQICKEYDRLIKKYDPGFKESESAIRDLGNTKCDATGLWERYTKAMPKVTALFQEGRITEKVLAEFRVMDVKIGTLSTTDLPKACKVLEEYEAKLSKIK